MCYHTYDFFIYNINQITFAVGGGVLLLPDILTNKEYTGYDKFLMLMSVFAAVLPEYIAPIAIIAFYPFVHHHFALHGRKILFGKMGKMFFGYTIYMMTSIVWSKTRGATFITSLLWMAMFWCYLSVANLCDTKKKIENIILCLSASGAACSIVSIFQMIFAAVKLHKVLPNPLYAPLDKFIFGFLPLGLPTDALNDRAASVFNDPMIFAALLTMIMPLSVFLSFYASTKRRRMLAAIATIVIFVGLLLTFSVAAAIAVLISLLVLAIMGKRPAIFMSGGVVLTALLIPFVIYERSKHSLTPEMSLNERVSVWSACLMSIKTHPIFGIGIGSQEFKNVVGSQGLNDLQAHNLYIQILTEAGFFGIIFFIAIIAFIFYNIYTIYKCGGWWRRISLAMLSSVIGFLVISIFEYTLKTPKELMYFLLILGVIEATKRVSQKHKENYDAEAIEEHNRTLRELSESRLKREAKVE